MVAQALHWFDLDRFYAEARRVLRDGGKYLLVIWDKVERNLATKTVGAAVGELFPEDATAFSGVCQAATR